MKLRTLNIDCSINREIINIIFHNAMEAKEPQDQSVNSTGEQQQAEEMWDHQQQLRFTLAWAAHAEEGELRDLVVRSLYATFRRQPKRKEPPKGFQLHSLVVQGTVYFKILFHDARECKMRALRYQLFDEYK